MKSAGFEGYIRIFEAKLKTDCVLLQFTEIYLFEMIILRYTVMISFEFDIIFDTSYLIMHYNIFCNRFILRLVIRVVYFYSLHIIIIFKRKSIHKQ